MFILSMSIHIQLPSFLAIPNSLLLSFLLGFALLLLCLLACHRHKPAYGNNDLASTNYHQTPTRQTLQLYNSTTAAAATATAPSSIRSLHLLSLSHMPPPPLPHLPFSTTSTSTSASSSPSSSHPQKDTTLPTPPLHPFPPTLKTHPHSLLPWPRIPINPPSI